MTHRELRKATAWVNKYGEKIAISKMSTEYIKNIITLLSKASSNNSVLKWLDIFQKELKFRKNTNTKLYKYLLNE